MSGEFSRAPRRPVPILKSDRLDTQRRVQADARFRALPARSRLCLLVAVSGPMDGEGKWWWKVRRWAAAADYSESTVKRAIVDCSRVALIRCVPYLRPDAKQGSSTYWLDARLLAQLPDIASGDPPCADPPPVTNNRSLLQASLGGVPIFDSGGSGVTYLVDEPPQGRSAVTDLVGRQAGSAMTDLVDRDAALFDEPRTNGGPPWA